MARKTYQEFPRAVYGPGGDVKIIHSEDERPEGYGPSPTKRETVADAKAGAREARKASREAEIAERRGLTAFLDEHDVEYAKNLGLAKLRALAEELKAYLATQGDTDDHSA